MTDLIMLAIMIAFFALAVLFIKGCERIVRPDVETARADVAAAAEESVT